MESFYCGSNLISELVNNAAVTVTSATALPQLNGACVPLFWIFGAQKVALICDNSDSREIVSIGVFTKPFMYSV